MSTFQVLFFLLSAVVGLLQMPSPSGAIVYYVKPTDNDSEACDCSLASMNTSAEDLWLCMTLNDYAKIFKSCDLLILCIDMDITMIFLPGEHRLEVGLYIHNRRALKMVKCDHHTSTLVPGIESCSCHREVEIQLLHNASMTFSMITQFTLDGIVISSTSDTMTSLILNNIPWHRYHYHRHLDHDLLLNITDVHLNGSSLMHECDSCSGKVNWQNVSLEDSSTAFRIKDSHILLSNITSVYLTRSSLMYECDNSSGALTWQNVSFEDSFATFRIKNSHGVLTDITSVHLTTSALIHECDNCSGEVNWRNLSFENSSTTFRIKNSRDLLSNITSVHLIKRSTLMYECNNSSGEVNLQGLLFEASTATFSIKSSHDLLSNITSVHLIKRSTLMYECNNSSGEVNLQGLLFEASTATFSIKSSHDLLSNIASVHLIKRSTLMYECNNSSGEVNLQGLLFEASTATFSIKSSCLLYTSPSPRDATLSRMPSSA